MSGLARRVRRGRVEGGLSGYAIRRRIAELRKQAGLGKVATSLAQIALERMLFKRKPTARTRNGKRARG